MNEIYSQKMEISTSKIAIVIALLATLATAVKPFFPEKTGLVNNIHLVDPTKERVQDTKDPNLEMHDLGPAEGDLLPIQE